MLSRLDSLVFTVKISDLNNKASNHEKSCKQINLDFMNLHRLLGMTSGATNFTETSRQDILSTVKFPDFIYSSNRSYKIKKYNKLATKINSTESQAKVIDLQILPKPRYGLNMFQKNYQALFLPD